ncbi:MULTISPECIES: DUF1800 family protein [unclassified Frankia]|uniref:DUF1800 domain-containing protein n=1 Tax=unclassified Frankia TaxID=2632575 RepID=UPI0006CA3381|nr:MULTISPECIES: DUF1800 domain-containing protein [unclassified Frankia]
MALATTSGPTAATPGRAASPPAPAEGRAALALLFRRAGFGARPDELDAAEKAGFEATVDALLRARDRPDPAAVAPPDLDREADHRPPDLADKAARAAYAKGLRERTEALIGWWLRRMVATADPVTEKLTLFWHGHFATSIQKVRSPALMLAQNEILRRAGRGRFDELTLAVAQDPAMLLWLDAGRNVKANANENFARELMELFTLGIGAYGETDVREAARAFTGWRADRSGRFTVLARQHDSGTKTVLGQTGNLGGEDVIDLVTHTPASPRWVCSRLWSRYAAPVAPGDPAIAGLLAAYGPGLDTGAALRALLLAPGLRATAGQLVVQPVEYVVGVLRALRLTVPEPGAATGAAGAAAPSRLIAVLRGLGQVPFIPPSVGGWPAGGAWLTTAASLTRSRFATAVTGLADLSAVADVPPGERVDAAARLLSVPAWSTRTRDALSAARDDPRQLVTLALLAPEYVVT